MIQLAWVFLNDADPEVVDHTDHSNIVTRSKQLRSAISRWENEGGADSDPLPDPSTSGGAKTDVNLTNAELVQLQVRVIALENLVIALLTGAPDQTLSIARALAADISPREGHTPHVLTSHAAELMVQLVERAALLPDHLKTNQQAANN